MRSASCGGKPGPSSLTSITHARPRGARARRRGLAPPCRTAFSSRLTTACSTSTASTDEGQVGRDAHVETALSRVALDPGGGGSEHLLERVPFALGLERAGLEPRHVQQVADESVEALGLLEDGRRELSRERRGRRLLHQAAGRAGDRGERCAQVVRDGAQQRAAQPLALRREPRLLGLLGDAGPLERRGDLACERHQQLALVRRERTQRGGISTPRTPRQRAGPRAARRAPRNRAACR